MPARKYHAKRWFSAVYDHCKTVEQQFLYRDTLMVDAVAFQLVGLIPMALTTPTPATASARPLIGYAEETLYPAAWSSTVTRR